MARLSRDAPTTTPAQTFPDPPGWGGDGAPSGTQGAAPPPGCGCRAPGPPGEGQHDGPAWAFPRWCPLNTQSSHTGCFSEV